MNVIKSITVFCGSSCGEGSSFSEKAYELGKIMAGRNIALIYGGGCHGLMGQVARGCFENGGHTTGIIPQFMNKLDLNPPIYETERVVVETMHERKKLMAERTDAFIALPGGIGTFEEIMEQMAWLQLRLHSKPCGFLNVDGFYDLLEAFLDNSVRCGFVKQQVADSVQWDCDPAMLIEKLETADTEIARKADWV